MQTEDELDPLFCEPLAFDETALCSEQLKALMCSSPGHEPTAQACLGPGGSKSTSEPVFPSEAGSDAVPWLLPEQLLHQAKKHFSQSKRLELCQNAPYSWQSQGDVLPEGLADQKAKSKLFSNMTFIRKTWTGTSENKLGKIFFTQEETFLQLA